MTERLSDERVREVAQWIALFNANRSAHIAITYDGGWQILDWLERNGPSLHALCREILERRTAGEAARGEVIEECARAVEEFGKHPIALEIARALRALDRSGDRKEGGND